MAGCIEQLYLFSHAHRTARLSYLLGSKAALLAVEESDSDDGAC